MSDIPHSGRFLVGFKCAIYIHIHTHVRTHIYIYILPSTVRQCNHNLCCLSTPHGKYWLSDRVLRSLCLHYLNMHRIVKYLCVMSGRLQKTRLRRNKVQWKKCFKCRMCIFLGTNSPRNVLLLLLNPIPCLPISTHE